MKSISEYRKAVVAAIGTACTLAVSALDLFDLGDPAENWLAAAVALATTVGVYLTKNAETIDSLG